MTVGDVVSGFSAANTILDFQPAAGVECIIIQPMSSNSGESPNLMGLTDGTIYTPILFAGAGSVQAYAHRIAINNTRYLRLRAAGGGFYSSYTGFQTK